MVSTRKPPQNKRHKQTKSKRYVKDISWKWNFFKAGAEILISDKIHFKAEAIVRNKGQYIMIEIAIQQEDITLVNIYSPNVVAPKYVKQILMGTKAEINRNTGIVGYFNTSLTSMDRSSRQEINKETVTLSDTLDQMDLIDIFRDIFRDLQSITPKLQNIHTFQVHMECFLG